MATAHPTWPEISGIQLAPLSIRTRKAIFAPEPAMSEPQRRREVAVRRVGYACMAAFAAMVLALGVAAPARGAMLSWVSMGLSDSPAR
jgi:hypothetical protein